MDWSGAQNAVYDSEAEGNANVPARLELVHRMAELVEHFFSCRDVDAMVHDHPSL